jgi:hypothetical protein
MLYRLDAIRSGRFGSRPINTHISQNVQIYTLFTNQLAMNRLLHIEFVLPLGILSLLSFGVL